MCSFGQHRWVPISVDGQKGRECRDCHRRDFDPPNAPNAARTVVPGSFSALPGRGRTVLQAACAQPDEPSEQVRGPAGRSVLEAGIDYPRQAFSSGLELLTIAALR